METNGAYTTSIPMETNAAYITSTSKSDGITQNSDKLYSQPIDDDDYVIPHL